MRWPVIELRKWDLTKEEDARDLHVYSLFLYNKKK